MPGLFQALRNTAVDLMVMDVKHNESAQRGLVPVLSSCTYGFPAEALQALKLGRHGGGLRELWKTGQEDLPLPRVHCLQGSEPRARNGVRGYISGMSGAPLIPSSLLTTQ